MMRHVLHGRPRRALALLLAGFVVLALLPATPARAATSKTVKTSAGDKVADDGACSLREVLQALYQPANDDCGSVTSPLTVTFDAPGTIQLKEVGDVLPNISGGKIVTITGPVIIDGRDNNGVPGNIFDIDADSVLNLANLTLTRGARAVTVNAEGTFNAAGVSFIDNSQDGSGGGAILSTGKVNIAGSLFTANSAPGVNGNGGAIIALGSDTLNIAGTIFSGNSAKNSGGAIYATTGVNLVDVIFNGNIAEADDGDDEGQDEGGGALFLQTDNENEQLTVTRSIFNGNLSPDGSGGALHLGLDVPATVRDSSFNGNIAGTPGNDAPSAGGAIWSAAKLDLLHSTLLNNAVVGDGGAVANDRRGQLAISNSTLIANAATDQGGGIATLNSQQGSGIRPKTTALNVTLALNAAAGEGDAAPGEAGGGLYSEAPTPSYPEVTILGNTIVAGSDGPGLGGNCGGGAYTSRGGNLDSGSSCGLGAAQSNLNANLEAPAFNGGPIDTLLTMKPLPGSAAIDAGVAAICAAAPVAGEDQTGAPRTADGDGVPPSGCDSGALEGPAAVAGFGSQPVAPGPILFGNGTVNLDPPLAASLQVFNTGTGPLTVSAAAIGGVNPADFKLTTPVPFTIAPGGQPVTLALTCKPTATGDRSGGLTLSTNDPARPTVTFDLQCTGTPTPVAGFGAQPEEPGPIDVGDVRLGQTGAATLTFKEIGTAALQISGAALGGLNPGDFNVSTAPINIPNGGSPVNVTVSCTPTALGVRSATLTVQTNDPTRASASFSLVCTGRPAPQLVIEPAGQSRPSAAVNTGSGPYGLAVSPDGAHLYAADSGDNLLSRFRRDGAGYLGAPQSFPDGGAGGPRLEDAWIVAVSPDGKNVYATSGEGGFLNPSDDAVSAFRRDPATGDLTFLDEVHFNEPTCVFSDPQNPCDTFTTGLNEAYGIALSPDGKYVYVSAVSSDTISVLFRNPDDGRLRNIFNRPALVQEVKDSTNLNEAYGIALSPDGKHLYATGYASGTLVAYTRNQTNGRLSPVGGGVYGKGSIPSLNGVFRVAVSPDGNFVYTASYTASAVSVFRRNQASGALSFVKAYTNGQGGVEGLASASAVAVSPDGRYLFATGYGSGAVSVFLRDQETGELDQVQTIARSGGGQPPLGGARDVVVSPDGRMIFVSGYSDNQVTAFALANPKPVLTSLGPASATAGAAAPLTLAVNGEGFVPQAVVTWNGADLPTQFVSSGELRATVAAGLLGSPGTAQVGARNPAPGGGAAANALTFTVTAPNQNPVPSLERVEPAGAAAGAAPLTATVFGAGFLPTSRVLWNGEPRETTYVSGAALQVALTTADLAQPGLNAVAVRNPAPGGGASNSVGFEVAGPGENPTPTIVGLSPQSANAGVVSGELLVTIGGAGFVPGARARWNGEERPTTFVSATQLRVALSAADLVAPGAAGIDVVNPEPGGGASNVAAFTIGAAGDRPVPSVTGAKLSLGAGGALLITVSGRDFVAGATVRWNGRSYTPSAVAAGQIVFTVPPRELRSATLSVVNPGPGGGPSDELLVQLRQLAIPALRR